MSQPETVHRQRWEDDFNGTVPTGLCECGAPWSPEHRAETKVQWVDAGPAMIVFYPGREMTDEVRDRVCAWVRANGLDPSRMPETAAIVVHGTRLTFREAIGDEGHRVTRTAPLLVLPPDDLMVPGKAASDA